MSEPAIFEGWAILELMGHRRLAGHISAAEICGKSFLRLDVPSGCGATSDNWCPVCGKCACQNIEDGKDDGECPLHGGNSKHGEPQATQFYAPDAVYCLTPCTEDLARQVAACNKAEPVKRWELPALTGPTDDDGDDDDA